MKYKVIYEAVNGPMKVTNLSYEFSKGSEAIKCMDWLAEKLTELNCKIKERLSHTADIAWYDDSTNESKRYYLSISK